MTFLVITFFVIAIIGFFFILSKKNMSIAETCNNFDDDKDGQVDEAFVCKTSFVNKITDEHPRLFISKENIDMVRDNALRRDSADFLVIQKNVDSWTNTPSTDSTEMFWGYVKNSTSGKYDLISQMKPKTYGVEAQKIAFVYLVTGDKKYLEKAKIYMNASIKGYQEHFDRGMAVDWYAFSRIEFLCAYDWLYNDLTPAERTYYYNSMLTYMDQFWKGPKPIYRINNGDYKGGPYGEEALQWYVGLAGYKDGINDAKAEYWLRQGFQLNKDTLDYRDAISGDDGGVAAPTLGYAIGAYPLSSLNFIYSWKSATGENIAEDFKYLKQLPTFYYWQMINTETPQDFCLGDAYHYDCNFYYWLSYMHLTSVMNLYSDTDSETAKMANLVRNELPKDKNFPYGWLSFYQYMMKYNKNIATFAPTVKDQTARHFEGLGEVVMRSGWNADDTYAVFVAGGITQSHKQQDQASFVIYKDGYLAMDTGTRGDEGMKFFTPGWENYNLRMYYYQSIAHNTVLVQMPNEPFTGGWQNALGLGMTKPNATLCGGQDKVVGGKVLAYETNEYYTYTVDDATETYSSKKMDKFYRTFLFIQPDYFIVFDNVISDNPAYEKQWLLHTQNEPIINGNTFTATHWNGTLITTTLYPFAGGFRYNKIGGIGKEFWACGENMLPEQWVYDKYREKGLFGNWRIEIVPTIAQKQDYFLNFIQVGNKNTIKQIKPQTIDNGKAFIVKFEADGKSYEVTLEKEEPRGHIKISQSGIKLIDQDFRKDVMPQSGTG